MAGTVFPGNMLGQQDLRPHSSKPASKRTARGRGLKNADTDIPLRIHRRSGADRRGRMAGSPFRQQPPRRQHPARTDAAARRDRRRRRGRPPAPGAGTARQCRASPDDRRPERHRGRTQYRARDAQPRSNGAAPGGRRAAAAHRAAARCRLERRGGKSRFAIDRRSSSPNRKCRSRRRAPRGPPSPTKSAARRRRRCRNVAAIH